MWLPGSDISSFRQRAGRVGRVGEGLVVLVVGVDPLQQFIAHDPTALQLPLAGKPEEVVLNPNATEIVRRFGRPRPRKQGQRLIAHARAALA